MATATKQSATAENQTRARRRAGSEAAQRRRAWNAAMRDSAPRATGSTPINDSPKLATKRRRSGENQRGPARAAAYQAKRSPARLPPASSGQSVNAMTASA